MRYPAAVNRLESGHDSERADCGILSLANYLGVPWPEILRAATLADKRHMGRDGLTTAAIKRMARLFGVTLVPLRNPDWDEAYAFIRSPDHAAVLRNGLVMDRHTVWEWEHWLVDQKVSAHDCTLYVVKE